MQLLIDQGNTRLKWRLLDAGGGVRVSGFADTLHWRELARSVSGTAPLECIWVASVLSRERQDDFAKFLEIEYACQVHFARVQANCLGVKPAYNELSKLGVDRWLGLLSAYTVSRRECMVVSAGTAITVDLLDGAGQHLGGLIFPGAGLLREALRQRSAALQSPGTTAPGHWSPGRSTQACIEAGLTAGVAGFAQQVEHYAQSHLQRPEVFVTGGDAESFALHLQASHTLCESLVLDGLYLVSKA